MNGDKPNPGSPEAIKLGGGMSHQLRRLTTALPLLTTACDPGPVTAMYDDGTCAELFGNTFAEDFAAASEYWAERNIGFAYLSSDSSIDQRVTCKEGKSGPGVKAFGSSRTGLIVWHDETAIRDDEECRLGRWRITTALIHELGHVHGQKHADPYVRTPGGNPMTISTLTSCSRIYTGASE